MSIYESSVAFRSRQNELRDIGLSGQDDLPAGFGERFTSANELTFNRYTPLGRDRAFEDFYKKRDDILINKGLISKELLTTKRLMDRRDSGNYPNLNTGLLGRALESDNIDTQLGFFDPELFEVDVKENDQLLMDLKSAHPELNIMSDEEISSKVMMDQLEILSRDEDLAERSNFLGKVGYLTGSMVGWLRDPVHFASSLAGITPVGRLSMLQNFFRVGAAEAAVVSSLEFAEKAGEVSFRRRTGEEDLTTQQALIESATNVGLGFVVGGSIGALIGGFTRPIPPSLFGNNNVSDRTQTIVDEARLLQNRGFNFDSEIAQAVDMLDEAMQIARSAPLDTSYETHLNNYSNARNAIADSRNVPGPDDLDATIRASDQDVDAPTGSETASPNTELDVQDRAILSMRETLANEDIVISTRNKSGDITKVSSRDILAGLDMDDAAVRATINCLG